MSITLSNKVIKPNKSEINSSANLLAEQYQKKSDKQHILNNPDTYIGSVETVDANMWVFDNETNKIINFALMS